MFNTLDNLSPSKIPFHYMEETEYFIDWTGKFTQMFSMQESVLNFSISIPSEDRSALI